MKRTERHQLKENEVALAVARAKESFEAHRNEYTIIAILIVAVLAGVGGYYYWRQSVDASSRAMLADAMAVADAQVVPPSPPAAPGSANAATPPPAPPPGSFPTERARLEAALAKFEAAANAYPSAPASIAARYEAAATLVELGRLPEAIRTYQEVIDRAPSTLYADTARLGLAEAQLRAGQFDAAIATFRTAAAQKDGKMPVDGILIQLGRAYALAGKPADARQTFQRIVDEFPQSSYTTVARKELESIKAAG